MKEQAISQLTDQELVKLCAEQATIHRALTTVAEANRAFDKAVAIWREISRRGPKCIELFSQLMDFPDPAVRLFAAANLLFIMPEKAEKVIEDARKEPRQIGASAEVTLREWRAGRLKPLI